MSTLAAVEFLPHVNTKFIDDINITLTIFLASAAASASGAYNVGYLTPDSLRAFETRTCCQVCNARVSCFANLVETIENDLR